MPFPPQPDPAEPDAFAFSGSVGPEGENRREDVIRAQILLGEAGDFPLSSFGIPTGWPSSDLWRGIRQYQRRRGLVPDGILLPAAGHAADAQGRGETLVALRRDLGDSLAGHAVPTPQEVDRHYDRAARFDGAPGGTAADEIVERGQVLPVGRTADGRTTWAVPQMLRDAYAAVTLPGDVWAGRVDPQSEDGFTRMMNLAGLAAGSGVVGRTAPARLPGNSRASRSAGLYNPPAKPPRPFTADYPSGAQADEAGRLVADIEGRPLTAEFVAGRRMVGGAEAALTPAEIRSIGEKGTGRPVKVIPQSALGRDVGRARFGRYTGQPEEIALSERLTAPQAGKVLAHEVGHVIDQMAGEIPTAGLQAELRGVYDTLNTGRERGAQFFGPQQAGYKGDDVPREFMAEAIRAYMADPNYLKTVAPKTAATIRKFVNDNPRLKQIVQFNTVAGGLGFAAGDDSPAAP